MPRATRSGLPRPGRPRQRDQRDEHARAGIEQRLDDAHGRVVAVAEDAIDRSQKQRVPRNSHVRRVERRLLVVRIDAVGDDVVREQAVHPPIVRLVVGHGEREGQADGQREAHQRERNARTRVTAGLRDAERESNLAQPGLDALCVGGAGSQEQLLRRRQRLEVGVRECVRASTRHDFDVAVRYGGLHQANDRLLDRGVERRICDAELRVGFVQAWRQCPVGAGAGRRVERGHRVGDAVKPGEAAGSITVWPPRSVTANGVDGRNWASIRDGALPSATPCTMAVNCSAR